MAEAGSFTEILSDAFSWLKSSVSALFTWATQDKASIRSALVDRTSEWVHNEKVLQASGRGILGQGLNALGDLVTEGKVTDATGNAMTRDSVARMNALPTEERASLRELARDMHRLQLAGNFSEAELADVTKEAMQRTPAAAHSR